jgi:hypothetical protein
MPDRSPAELLTSAAKKLRLAATADYITPGPWISLDGGDRLIRDPGSHPGEPQYVVDEPMNNISNAEYIATVHPGVGLALAEWLDDAAEGDEHGELSPYAVAVAQQVLGREGSRP